MFLALREFAYSKTRFILISLIIFLVSYLVFFLTGLAYGLSSSYTQAIEGWQTKYIIISKTANYNPIASQISKVEISNIETAIPKSEIGKLLIAPASVSVVESDGGARQQNIFIFGITERDMITPNLVEGKLPQNNDETVIDESLLANGIKIGDEIALEPYGKSFKVVGVASKSKFQVSPVVFLKAESFQKNLLDKQRRLLIQANMLVLQHLGKNQRQRLDTMLDSYGLQRVSIADFVNELPGYRAQVLTFSLMIGSLIGIVALVIGIFVYIFTIQKRQIFGIMKVQGISTGYIVISGVAQTFLITCAGVGGGLGVALLTGAFLPQAVPFLINIKLYALVCVAFFLFTTLGGVLPIRTISRIDPVEVVK